MNVCKIIKITLTVFLCALIIACATTQNPTVWTNWNKNITFKSSSSNKNFYFTPSTRSELLAIIQKAALQHGNVKLHVSGQRHSGSPIVINNSFAERGQQQWLIDLSCYHDLGNKGLSNMLIDKQNKTVTVNAGVREDEVEAFITSHNLMFKTITAGGFFSIGGMSAVDVHGATVNETNFPGTIESFTVMGSDGVSKTYDAGLQPFNGYNVLQFQRVSLGTLGVITSVTIKLDSRPYKTSLYGRLFPLTVYSKTDFIKQYTPLLFSSNKARVESFYSPYHSSPNIMALYWNVDNKPKQLVANDNFIPGKIKTACQIAKEQNWGAPFQGAIKEPIVDKLAQAAQDSKNPQRGEAIINLGFANVKSEMQHAIANHSAMWLTKAAQVIFMSYTIPLPHNQYHGLDVAYDALQVINQTLDQSHDFILAAPVEFRFLRGDNALLSAAYTKNPRQRYISIEVIGFPEMKSNNQYTQNLLNFFARVECGWAKLDGFPHQGKMYGFYNPETYHGYCNQLTGTAPFNAAYLTQLQQKKQLEIAAFKSYQHKADPFGVFCTSFAKQLGIC